MESLDGYKKQLEVVCSALESENNEELLSLKENLEQMIILLQEGNMDIDQEACSENSAHENDARGNEEHEIGDLIGAKCSVKYDYPGLSNTLHNAMVCGMDETDGSKVLVFFLYPLNVGMKTCKDFLDGKCAYGSSCRFCHGYSVKITELADYVEPDFENVRVGTNCLAKNTSDDLWYPAVIEFIVDVERCIVRYRNVNCTIELPFTAIYPLGDVNEEEQNDDDIASGESAEENEDAAAAAIHSSTHEKRLAAPARFDKNQFGSWEVHTKRIASKLMAKMGYVPGKGLGKLSNGRVNPVPVKIIPKGSSLDEVMRLKQSKKLINPIKVKKLNVKKKETTYSDGAFELINKSLRRKGEKICKIREDAKSKELSINAQILRIEDEIKNVTKKILKLYSVLEVREIRNDKRDFVRLNDTIAYEENTLRLLKEKEKDLKDKQIKQKLIDELTQF